MQVKGYLRGIEKRQQRSRRGRAKQDAPLGWED
jgi:hypothetical protein